MLDAVRNASDSALKDEIALAAGHGVDLTPAFPEAIRERRLPGFVDLATRTGERDLPNGMGTSLLMLAILGRCDLRIARWLIQNGANVRHTNRFGEDALYLACHEDAPSLVRPLLDAGADPTLVTSRGSTAMLELVNHAKRTGTLGSALRLMARRATATVWTAQDPNGITPLMRAYGVDRNGWNGTLDDDRLLPVLLKHGAGVAMKVGDASPLFPSPWTMTANDPTRRQALEKGFATALAMEQNSLRAAMDDTSCQVPVEPTGRVRL